MDQPRRYVHLSHVMLAQTVTFWLLFVLLGAHDLTVDFGDHILIKDRATSVERMVFSVPLAVLASLATLGLQVASQWSWDQLRRLMPKESEQEASQV